MKAKRLLFLVMTICLASGVKAQFYDGPDDIYFYVSCDEDNGKMDNNGYTLIFNFDGLKAANLAPRKYYGMEGEKVGDVKDNLRRNSSIYEERVEMADYDITFVTSTSSGITYKMKDEYHNATLYIGAYATIKKFDFSPNRDILYFVTEYKKANGKTEIIKNLYKRVGKSYFKSGRSRTASGTMYE